MVPFFLLQAEFSTDISLKNLSSNCRKSLQSADSWARTSAHIHACRSRSQHGDIALYISASSQVKQ